MSKESLYITKDGILKMKNTTMYFITKEQSKPIPIERIHTIYFIGSGSVSTGVLKVLKKNSILLHFFDRYGNYTGTFYPKDVYTSGELLVRQVSAYKDFEMRLNLAKAFVRGAYLNIKHVVSRHSLGDLPTLDLEGVENIPQLMQREGNIRKYFYKLVDSKLSDAFKIQKREIQPPSNRGNAVVSFLNSLVYAAVASEIYHTHLHPAVSYLHEPFERRYSLSLDVSEIFKPLLSERLFIKMVNLKMLDEVIDFEDSKGVFLSQVGRKKVLSLFDEELNKVVKMRTNNKRVSIRELIRIELYKLEKHLLNIKEYKSLNAWW